MKRTLQLVIALAISIMFVASPVAAASNQGLSWGMTVGDALNYKLTSSSVSTTATLNEGFYMNVTDTPAIPNSITDWVQVPGADIDLWWTNGTSIGLYALVFLGLIFFGGHFVVPIGNYTLLAQMVKTSPFWNTSTTFVNSSLYWGMKLVDSETAVTQTLQASYLKSDGALATYSIISTNNTSHTQSASLQVTRNNLPPEGFDIVGFIQQNMLLVGAGVAVVVILGAVLCMKRK